MTPKLSGAVCLPERKDVTRRELESLEECDCVNLMVFTRGKCKVLRMDQGNAHYQYMLTDEGIENSPAKKDLGVAVG